MLLISYRKPGHLELTVLILIVVRPCLEQFLNILAMLNIHYITHVKLNFIPVLRNHAVKAYREYGD